MERKSLLCIAFVSATIALLFSFPFFSLLRSSIPVVGYSYPSDDLFIKILNTLYFSAQIFCLILIISRGHIVGSVHGYMLLITLGILSTGVVFKILHLKFGNEFIVLGTFSLSLIYFIWFLSKRTKGLLDILKLIWVLSLCIIKTLMILHYLSPEYNLIPIGFFWLMFFDFIYFESRKSREDS